MSTQNGKKTPQTDVPTAFGFGGIFEGIQKLVEAAAKMKDSAGVSQTGEFSVPGLGEKGKGIFGFSIRTMDSGQGPEVQVRPFGNIHKTKEGMAVEEDREPVVDVLEEGGLLRVIAELPGVSAGEISFEVKGDVVTIATSGKRRYHAEVLLPARAEAQGAESSYNNGVFELNLRRVANG